MGAWIIYLAGMNKSILSTWMVCLAYMDCMFVGHECYVYWTWRVCLLDMNGMFLVHE